MSISDRKEINPEELENVTGGTVYLSKDFMKIGFSTLKQNYKLKGCTFGQALALTDAIYEQHKDEGNQAIDEAVKAAFEEKGWI